MKILLFGGTFDPPHNGHMNNLRAALNLIQPDRAIVMPAGVPPHKHAATTPGPVRLQMCRCFLALSPVVEVSDWELTQPGPSYTIQTLEMLRTQNPAAQLYLNLGSDMLCSFTQWRRWQAILALATLVVQSRETDDRPALEQAAAPLRAAGGTVLFAAAQPLPCSSTQIRTGQIPRDQLAHYLPPATMRVVEEYGLYKNN